MRIVIASVKIPFIRGGAEVHAQSLHSALAAAGHEVELIEIPFKWYPPEQILDHMLACRLLDLTESTGSKIDLLIGLKFPAYYISHPNKVLWILHQHRQAYELWNHPIARDMILFPNGPEIRESIMEADRTLIPEAKAVFANSRNVANRLKRFCGIDATPLYHPPPHAEHFFHREAQDFFFFPSRLTPIKRQHLIVEAVALTKNPVRVLFAGLADMPGYLKELKAATGNLGLEDRIEWAGGITEEDKRQRYADCLGVIYPPVDEDYGYVTLEAMLSSKPVVTCSDSGGTNEFVDAHTGFVTDPDPGSIAVALDTLWENRERAKSMGLLANERYRALGISWPRVVGTLLA